MALIILLGTCDTKLQELLYLREELLRNPSVEVSLMDVGRTEVQHPAISPAFRHSKLLEDFGNNLDLSRMERGEVIKTMSDCATQCLKQLYEHSSIHGIIAAGGSGGTSLAAAVMRNALPIGFPKLIVSTVASGDTGPIVEETDITLMYSVVDVAGLNQLLRRILTNAAAAMSGMAVAYAHRQGTSKPGMQSSPLPASPSPRHDLNQSVTKKRVGITMFGVTTPAVDAIREHLESGYNIECYVFHATGHGGKAMERLVREGELDAVLDLTTTEICDFLTGGNMSAGPNRLEAAAKAGIPNIISIGATDMSNFGPRSTVPERYKDRLLYEHNPVVTLMRTSVDEARQVGHFIIQKLKEHASNPNMVEVWLPTGGVSMISTPGGPFEDHSADTELFRSIKEGCLENDIKLVEDERAINDAGFAKDIATALIRKIGF